MKKLLSVCALALCFAAQTAHAQDAKAKAVLDGVTKKVNTLKTIKANFALKLTGGKVSDSKKGTIAIKGTKYHVTLTGQEIICDNKTVWTYSADAKEVTVSTFNPKDQSISPAKLLTNFYDKEYKYKYAGERTEGGKKCDVIELTPIDASKQTTKIELLVDKATSMIVGGNIWAKNGNKTQYMISNVVTNSAVADDFFVWNAKAHPGVEVNDLR
ncbi:gliding motility protein [Flavipsychrobacter stenotrophus]|uniref:Gliding motility protein n=1 Tax=Flavipsychrobacter stenotrophus TaxID=2077091 RepID=A0A2S7SWB2_9BACT|nr:outer membrane lipoprotein carrier protein LolA [Flavipsychrobacter stenotrophus]PQJ11222.1 gliding motility protein [Flavipsychrobacter stenotrophus]